MMGAQKLGMMVMIKMYLVEAEVEISKTKHLQNISAFYLHQKNI